MKTGLNQGLKFLKNKLHQSPLSWSIQRNNTQCTDVILKILSKTSLQNKRVVIEAIENELNKLISTNLSCLPLLFENLFVTITENITATGRLKKKAPMIVATNSKVVVEEDFVDSSSIKKKEFLEYRMSLCRFHLDPGSLNSLKLLNSITDCHNPELFRTQLLKAFLLFKWRQNFLVLVFDTFFYSVGLAILTFFIVSPNKNNQTGCLIVLLILNLCSSVKEANKAYHSLYKFVRNAWNLFDFCRIVMSFYYILNHFFIGNTDYSGLTIVTLCYWIRAVGYFRLFNKYRYLLRVIMEIIKDMIPFFLILFTSTIAFAILLCVSQNDMSFYYAFVNVYLLDQTNFLFDLNSFESVLVFFLASLLNPIIMLNLLIAIMGDTYDKVQEDQIVADYREMTELILEAEYLVFWNKKNLTLFNYIIRCDYQRNLNLEKNE